MRIPFIAIFSLGWQLDRLSMVGVNGSKFPAIRKHLQENIGNVYKDMDTSSVILIFSGIYLCSSSLGLMLTMSAIRSIRKNVS